MTADRTAKLREAIVKVLPIDWEDRTTVVEVVPKESDGWSPTAVVVWGPPERLADAIVAAVEGVLAEDETVEWSVGERGSCLRWPTMTESEARATIALRPETTYLIRRRLGPWQAVPDAT